MRPLRKPISNVSADNVQISKIWEGDFLGNFVSGFFSRDKHILFRELVPLFFLGGRSHSVYPVLLFLIFLFIFYWLQLSQITILMSILRITSVNLRFSQAVSEAGKKIMEIHKNELRYRAVDICRNDRGEKEYSYYRECGIMS